MQTILLTVGKTKTPYIIEGIKEYQGRLKHYTSFSLVELPDVKTSKSMNAGDQKVKEGMEILSRIQPSDYVILLDERGKQFTSVDFALYLEKLAGSGRKRLVFVIGGPYGFSEEIYKKADGKLSLSKMTFNHEMVRLFFIEQFYRAMTILRNEPYHHE